MNHKKLRRLYREERPQARHRRGRKWALGTTAPLAMPQGPAAVEPRLPLGADSRHFRILAVVDDFTRECLALVADTSLAGLRGARELDDSHHSS